MFTDLTPLEKNLPTPAELRKEGKLYQWFLREREEIFQNKWFLSQKAGHDVGWEAALLDWVANHREKWVAQQEPIS